MFSWFFISLTIATIITCHLYLLNDNVMIIFLFPTSFIILKLKLEDCKRIVTKGDFASFRNKRLENKLVVRFQSNGIESLIVVMFVCYNHIETKLLVINSSICYNFFCNLKMWSMTTVACIYNHITTNEKT